MRKSLRIGFIIYCFLLSFNCSAQPLSSKTIYTKADTLRGSNGPGRNWWDVKKYEIYVELNNEDSTLSGKTNIILDILGRKRGEGFMQIDLQQPLSIDSITYSIKEDITASGKINPADISHSANAWFFPAKYFSIPATDYPQVTLSIFYHGKPRVANRPPWDGGLIWKKSKDGSPWISVACQGLGASVWYPCKDYQGDEPDNGASLSMRTTFNVNAVANGKLISELPAFNYKFTNWEVKNPINNYNIIPYIGKYKNFSEIYKGEKGDLDVNYWVLEENVDKAKEQFKDVPRMLKAFEHWFGPYPFYEDGFKLVESPHLGMEHQSAIAYGNGFQNGYRGRDLSNSGWGLKWDFIIVHESGHEWWGNNITTEDLADMWVHEGFTNYSETLFTDYYYGTEAGNAYCQGTRKLIRNDIPIIGPYGVNKEGSGDMYYKGGNMLHTIRQVINDDSTFRQILRGLQQTFYHKIVSTNQIEKYISKQSKVDFSKVFDQYLRTVQVPEFQYQWDGTTLKYRWQNVVKGFKMPIKIKLGDKEGMWLKPKEGWQSWKAETKAEMKVDANFYVTSKEIK